MSTIRLAGSDTAFPCAPGDTILRAALRAGVGMSYSCNVGSCGNCRFELVEGSVTHLRADAPAWTDKDRARGRWLGCQAAPGGDCTVRFRPDPAAALPVRPVRRAATLRGRRDLNHDMAEFTFAVDGDPAFLPGQYALFHLDGVPGARVYSMANLCGDGGGDDDWRFIIRRVPGGAATGVLWGLAPGAQVSLDGPYGLAYLRPDTGRDIVLMAGGSGLSPMVSIARGALAATGARIHAYFGGRTAADCTPAAELALDPRVTVTAACSAASDGWDGPTGFVHQVALDALGETLRDHDIYFAGPAVMAQAVTAALHAAGVPRDQVHYDEFY